MACRPKCGAIRTAPAPTFPVAFGLVEGRAFYRPYVAVPGRTRPAFWHPPFLLRKQCRRVVGSAASRPAHLARRVRRIPARAFQRRTHLRFSLYEELRALGYRGSYSSVRDYLRPFRRIGAAPPSAPKVPKVRRITSWMFVTPTTSPTTSRSGSNRFSPAAHTSKQLQAMSSRSRRCSPNILVSN